MGSSIWRPDQVDAVTEAYNEYRRELHRKCRSANFDHHVMAEGLAEWISVKVNAEWAMREGMGHCGKHRGPHTLYQCICDEMQYWMLRAQGASIEDANVKVLGYNPTE